MRGNDKVIAHLNEALREELTAINQYFLHAEMCHSWGYHQLGGYIKKQSIDEMKHAEKLIERLLFLDAIHKFLRFTVFVRLAIFPFLFHANSL